MTNMRAAVFQTYGPPSVVSISENVPIPRPKHDEVLIKVHYTSVSSADNRLRSARFGGDPQVYVIFFEIETEIVHEICSEIIFPYNKFIV